eukprot:6005244-Pleurochrysis_carterae.AAC.1
MHACARAHSLSHTERLNGKAGAGGEAEGWGKGAREEMKKEWRRGGRRSERGSTGGTKQTEGGRK